ncbi:MAG: aspartate--ammonia ligase [Erysipelotrichaceae bacterium]|nr:aspartate--ammonia ligase [Erysipelotrichaceae bacterium]
MKLFLTQDYLPKLDILETQIAIKLIKDTFERELANNLQLTRVSAPLYVPSNSGLNDNLNGYERPVSFTIKDMNEAEVEVVHSLAKWKRMALKRYGIPRFKGIYADMNAIRRDEELDNIHSTYVDQWDFEKVIFDQDRTLDYLQTQVTLIMRALKRTEEVVNMHYSILPPFIEEKVYFITSKELLARYPHLSSKEREHAICREHHTVFVMQIGDTLENGYPHDGRAPDYDDWSLNGDLLVYYPLMDQAIEISSMGIRVDEHSLVEQLKKAHCEDRLELPFHQALMNHELPLTFGGGLGQSRICMLLLQKIHIGEVQASIWPQDMIELCEKYRVTLL